MPVEASVLHLAFVKSNRRAASVAVLRKFCFKASSAEWSLFSHNVPLSTKNAVTVGALEVSHVPVVTFGLGTFISKDDLVTVVTSWLDGFGVVSTAREFPFAVKVEQVDQQFGAG